MCRGVGCMCAPRRPFDSALHSEEEESVGSICPRTVYLTSVEPFISPLTVSLY